MKKFSLLLLTFSISFFIITSCKKEIQTSTTENQSIKEWLLSNGGSYRNETIRVLGVDDRLVVGKLNWHNGNNYVRDNFIYLEFPYEFRSGERTVQRVTYQEGHAGFVIVFRKNLKLPDSEFEAAVRVTSEGHSLNKHTNTSENVAVSNYYSLSGETLNSWLKSSSSPNFQIAKLGKLKENKGSAKDLSGRIMDNNQVAVSFQQCVTYSTLTYFVTCRGTSMDNTVCTYKIVPQEATICFQISWIDNTDAPGGGWWPPPPNEPSQPDPCAEAKAGAEMAQETSKTDPFNTALSEIRNTFLTNKKENTIAFGKDANGNITRSALKVGGSSSGTVPAIQNRFADLHNHPKNSPPASGDIYTFIDLALKNSNYQRFVTTPNGTVYALILTNMQDAKDFNQNYPRIPPEPGSTYEPDFPALIDDEIREMEQLYSASKEVSISYILAKYKSGVALLKRNTRGEFKRLNAKEGPPNHIGLKTFVKDDCQ